jgi:MoxR-like ATPase
LVDETDNVSLDFANDLLFECAQLAFSIPEVTPADMAGFDCQRQHRIAPPVSDEDGNISCPDRQPRPVPVLTSNSDKNLREALPRRCAFHHIPFRTPGSACRPSGRTASSGNPSQKG